MKNVLSVGLMLILFVACKGKNEAKINTISSSGSSAYGDCLYFTEEYPQSNMYGTVEFRYSVYPIWRVSCDFDRTPGLTEYRSMSPDNRIIQFFSDPNPYVANAEVKGYMPENVGQKRFEYNPICAQFANGYENKMVVNGTFMRQSHNGTSFVGNVTVCYSDGGFTSTEFGVPTQSQAPNSQQVNPNQYQYNQQGATQYNPYLQGGQYNSYMQSNQYNPYLQGNPYLQTQNIYGY